MAQQKQEITKQDNSNPQNLIELAINQNADIEKLEKLMNLQERWEKNKARKAFYKAKAEFQKNKPTIPKSNPVNFTTKTGGNTSYNFADLDTMQKKIDPVLSENKLSYEWLTKRAQNEITIVCVLTHEDGHSERTELTAPADTSGNKNTLQAIGSTRSYLHRYTLESITGVSTSEDNDGKTAITNEDFKKLKLKSELQDLFRIKRNNLTDELIERVNSILDNDEFNSYQKTINYLKKA